MHVLPVWPIFMGSFITFSIFKSIFPEKMTVVSQVLVRMWGNWNSQGMKCKMAQLHWKTAQQFLKKFIICLPYDPSTPLLGVYPREMKSAVHTESWTRMFSAALFTPAKKSGMNQMSVQVNGHIHWHICAMDQSWMTKRNKPSRPTTLWMNLK